MRLTIVASVPVILLVLLALLMAWKMMGLMTSATTTAMASLTKWPPLLPPLAIGFLLLWFL